MKHSVEAEIVAMYTEELRRRVREEEHTGRHAATHATLTGGFAGTVDALQRVAAFAGLRPALAHPHGPA
jgi:hypothetical protein